MPAADSWTISDKLVSKYEHFNAHYKTTCVQTRRSKEVEADLMFYGVDKTYPDDGNNCHIDRSGSNFKEMQKVIPKQSSEIANLSHVVKK